MTTIERMLLDNWYTYKKLKLVCIRAWCNGCWGKWGFNFTKFMAHLPYFDSKKWNKLLNDLTLICNMHDIWYYEWGWFVDYIKANYKFAKNVFLLIHWTNLLVRVFILIILFVWTTLFWFKYFNWKRWI